METLVPSSADLAGDPAIGGTLSSGEAGLVLVAWTVPLLLAAILAERRRDLALDVLCQPPTASWRWCARWRAGS